MRCRICDGAEIQKVFSLGHQPFANALISPDKESCYEPKYPLELGFCPHCTQAQLIDTVPPEVLFTDYPYQSSACPAVVRNAKEIVERTVKERNLGSDSMVVEIASNDGYLLKNYDEHGIPRLGIDPAENVIRLDPKYDTGTRTAYFNKRLACELSEFRKADVIHANNVLAHVPDPNNFMQGIRELLKPTGVAIIEVPYARRMVERGEFDTIYHEHVFYWTLKTLTQLVMDNGLKILNAEGTELHGGTMRIWVGHPRREHFLKILEPEEINTFDFYAQLTSKAQQVSGNLWRALNRAKTDKKTVAAYGAAAKGTVLLNYAKIGTDLVQYVVDDAPSKQGKLMPGVHIPIYPPVKILEDPKPDYLLILAWNHAEDIIKRSQGFRGTFIIPIPELKTVRSWQ